MYMGSTSIRHTEIHTAEPLIPEPCSFEVETPVENLKKIFSSGSFNNQKKWPHFLFFPGCIFIPIL
jgi:hypothetical protein